MEIEDNSEDVAELIATINEYPDLTPVERMVLIHIAKSDDNDYDDVKAEAELIESNEEQTAAEAWVSLEQDKGLIYYTEGIVCMLI